MFVVFVAVIEDVSCDGVSCHDGEQCALKNNGKQYQGGLSLESRVKFPYIHESRNFLEPLLVIINTSVYQSRLYFYLFSRFTLYIPVNSRTDMRNPFQPLFIGAFILFGIYARISTIFIEMVLSFHFFFTFIEKLAYAPELAVYC